MRKAPPDLARLVWFLLRGPKGWTWATHGDLRADVRAARLAGDAQARREAQEAIRADAKARWAKLGIALRRMAISIAVALVVLVALLLVEKVFSGQERMTIKPLHCIVNVQLNASGPPTLVSHFGLFVTKSVAGIPSKK